MQLERLQAENAAEWGKSERLETEKLTLERDNKKLRAELRDMQERIERKGRPIANSDTEVRHLQQELSDKNKVSERETFILVKHFSYLNLLCFINVFFMKIVWYFYFFFVSTVMILNKNFVKRQIVFLLKFSLDITHKHS